MGERVPLAGLRGGGGALVRAHAYVFDSAITGTTHDFTTAQGLVEEVRGARIYGGMHFRHAMVRSEELGENVARWVAATRFQQTGSQQP